jgi:hypothetical protein
VNIDSIIFAARQCAVTGCPEPAERGEATCRHHPVPTFGISPSTYDAFRAAPEAIQPDVLAALRRLRQS